MCCLVGHSIVSFYFLNQITASIDIEIPFMQKDDSSASSQISMLTFIDDFYFVIAICEVLVSACLQSAVLRSCDSAGN